MVVFERSNGLSLAEAEKASIYLEINVPCLPPLLEGEGKGPIVVCSEM